MGAFTIVLLILGGLTMTVGGIMQLVAAFRQSLGWGLATLFLPFANFVFLVMHWAEAKSGFLTALAGAGMLVGAVFTSDPIRTAYAAAASGKKPPFSFAMLQPAPAEAPAKDLTTQIQEKRDRIEKLEAEFGQSGVALVTQFQALTDQRKTLRTDDAAAVAKFNAINAAYQAQNATQKQRQVELAETREKLESLLAERAKHPQAAGPAAKRVVMYTTATCPACRAAKEYFARKGVHYEEHDVNASPAAQEEFRRLGGSGVPLILVGNEKMEGFSEQRLNQLL